MESSIWPTAINYRALDATFYLTAIAILSFFAARRSPGKLSQFRNLSVSRWLVILALLDSWLFIYVSGVVVLGVGTSASDASCAVAIWWCITLYASSKVLIYSWLMERVYIVYSNTNLHSASTPSRIYSRAYQISAVFASLWIAVFVTMAVGRISFRRTETDGACVIGVRWMASIPMICVDAVVNIYLTAAFVLPLYKTKFTTARTVAVKSSIASIAALITSAVNIVILIVSHGHQLAFFCLISCGLDVTVNAIILFLVTMSDSQATVNKNQVTSLSRPSPFDFIDQRKNMGYRDEEELQLNGPLQFIGPQKPHQAVLTFPSKPRPKNSQVRLPVEEGGWRRRDSAKLAPEVGDNLEME